MLRICGNKGFPSDFRRNPLASLEERDIEAGMKKLLLCSLALVSLFMGSCNTMIGIGRDMRLGGEGLEKTATKATGGTSDSPDASGAPIY
jgi:predicted small secreted protein